MIHEFVRRQSSPKALRVVDTEKEKLHDALKSLYELLEKYGPVWYQKRHHDQAEIALRLSERQKPIYVAGSPRTLKRAA